MMRKTIELTDANVEELDRIVRRTGQSADDLVNAAVRKYASQSPVDDSHATPRWKQALFRIEGMWKDRDDLDEFYAQIRREADRVEPAGRLE